MINRLYRYELRNKVSDSSLLADAQTHQHIQSCLGTVHLKCQNITDNSISLKSLSCCYRNNSSACTLWKVLEHQMAIKYTRLSVHLLNPLERDPWLSRRSLTVRQHDRRLRERRYTILRSAASFSLRVLQVQWITEIN